MVEISNKAKYEGWFGALRESAVAQSLSELGVFAQHLGRELHALSGEAAAQLESLFAGMPHGVIELMNQALESQAAQALRNKFGVPNEELVGANLVAVGLTAEAETRVSNLATARREMQNAYEQFRQLLLQQLLAKVAEMTAVQDQLSANATAIQASTRPDTALAAQEYRVVVANSDRTSSRLQRNLRQLQAEVTALQNTMTRFLNPLGSALQQMAGELRVRPLDPSKAIAPDQVAQPA